MRSPVPALALALLVVLAGCTFGDTTPTPTDDGVPAGTPAATPSAEATPDPTPTDTPTPTETSPESDANAMADPAEDVVGWEQGYWHNESIHVDAEDGLNDSEFERMKARSMARVEVVRDLEFQSDVEFTFMTRETFLNQFIGTIGEDDWQDAYWEAAFVVGEDQRYADVRTAMYNVTIDGAAGSERVFMVVENPDSPRLNTSVLSHELIHTIEMQNEVFGPFPQGASQDVSQAYVTAVEGSAIYFEHRYVERCGEQWECIDAPVTAGVPPGSDEINMGMYLDFSVRYSAGGQFVASVADRGGLDAIEAMQQDPPTSTEQIVHPERYPDDEPTQVPIENRTGGDWQRMGGDEWGTFGEARLYTMLWYHDVVDPDVTVEVTVTQQVPTDFSHPATDGWAGDRVAIYENGSARGYVFKSVWENESEASEFRAAYLELLRSEGATEVREDVYVIESGPFADAFRVVQRGDTLLVVNAPTVAALEDVHAPE